MSCSKKQKGFSLLEAVIALGVASFALIATYDAFSGGVANIRTSNDRIAMMLFAEEKLSELLFTPLEEGVASGVSPNNYEWSRTVTPYVEDITPDGSTPLPPNDKYDLYRVQITVQAAGGAPVVLETLRRRDADG